CRPRRTPNSAAQATGRSRSRWLPEGPRSRCRHRSRSVARLTLIRRSSKSFGPGERYIGCSVLYLKLTASKKTIN
ncbi:hypothetical protein IscW_ISCW023902, partial [Ixodes scapularis]